MIQKERVKEKMATGTSIKEGAGRDAGVVEPERRRAWYRPAVDILAGAEELRVLAEVPGASADEIDVRYEDGRLTIHAKVQERQPSDAKYLLREYGVGDFHRVFELNEAIDVTGINAEYGDGILTLHLPKSEKSKARKIEISHQ